MLGQPQVSFPYVCGCAPSIQNPYWVLIGSIILLNISAKFHRFRSTRSGRSKSCGIPYRLGQLYVYIHILHRDREENFGVKITRIIRDSSHLSIGLPIKRLLQQITIHCFARNKIQNKISAKTLKMIGVKIIKISHHKNLIKNLK